MSISESSSESNSDTDDIFDDIIDKYGGNGFMFEPEYSESEVDARLLANQEFKDGDDDPEGIATDELGDEWCTCEQCLHMEHAVERVCCKCFSDIIGKKLCCKRCIVLTAAFQEVCLGTNVLEVSALGTWRHFTEEQLEISNKSDRFIAYRQFISWIYGWLGKDVRKIFPPCVVNKIRQTFPAADNVYIRFRDS